MVANHTHTHIHTHKRACNPIHELPLPCARSAKAAWEPKQQLAAIKYSIQFPSDGKFCTPHCLLLLACSSPAPLQLRFLLSYRIASHGMASQRVLSLCGLYSICIRMSFFISHLLHFICYICAYCCRESFVRYVHRVLSYTYIHIE